MTKELLKLCEFSPKNKWKLLYRASRDDFTPEAFHAKCDYYSNTLTIVKSSCGNIFGGYAQIEWNPNIYGNHDKEAFIFSLINDKKKPIKIKNSDSEFAVRYLSNAGPVFGRGLDLALLHLIHSSYSSYSYLGASYKHPDFSPGFPDANSFLAGAKYFVVTEIEVFQID